MKTFFYNLAGGINQASTKTDLGLDVKKLYWTNSKNVEILQNKGITRQKGNTLFLALENEVPIQTMHQLKVGNSYKLVFSTAEGKLFIYDPKDDHLKELEKVLIGKPSYVSFLNGVLISSEQDALFFIKQDGTIIDCNLKDGAGNLVYSSIIAIHKGRVWVADGATIYFSALGKYDDFEGVDDAGYIANFHTDTDDITALKPYKDYLAIYKKNMVYILTGSNQSDFAVMPFADKGACSCNCVVTVANKQYFFNQGVFALEQVGELNQIQLGQEITLKIKPEFDRFDKSRLGDTLALHYENKNQVWYFIPYPDSAHLNTIWINDYINKAWFKRVVPQNIVCATVFNEKILTADDRGRIYTEDFGATFDGQPIDFMWKSPFIAIGEPNVRKTVDEFYFLLDESFDNNFKFSVYKNYDSEYKDDLELIHSTNLDNLIWDTDGERSLWDNPDSPSLWATSTDSTYKAEISESNYSIQLCVEGSSKEQNAAIIGLEFKEIYVDE